ncbi:hypothetical protein [Novosphingobium sp.]|uniref:phage head-tail joining protein n=1 Tax=Novosphingobium sp. TaxID=1874826 RepID=UPI00260ABBA6|nr:hypothetical protein [Novosphingobium sp.]
MSFIQGQLDNLEAMIASGVLRSEYDGKRIEYRSLDELIRARDMARAQVQSTAPRVTHVNPTYDAGF